MKRLAALACSFVLLLPWLLLAALPATDNFNRANETPLAGNWTSCSNSFNLATNAVAGVTTSADNCVVWNADTWPDDQYSQVKVATVNGGVYQGAAVRMNADASAGYYCIGNNSDLYLQRCSGAGCSTHNNIANMVLTISAGDTIRIEVVGTSLDCKVNGVSKLTGTDATVTSGKAGIFYSHISGSATLDDWEGGSMAAASGPPPRRISGPY